MNDAARDSYQSVFKNEGANNGAGSRILSGFACDFDAFIFDSLSFVLHLSASVGGLVFLLTDRP